MVKAELVELLDDIGEVIDDDSLTPRQKVKEIDDILSGEDEEEEDEEEEG